MAGITSAREFSCEFYPTLSDINRNRNMSTFFCKYSKYEILRKGFRWNLHFSMRKDGQTNTTKSPITLRKANAP